ncbi:hypothetical protein KLP28_02585 [Nocardioidaceae bacterium]|nr:hypothetical protein KLP28_02585 [Nocardioidaceae bacterium]
MMPLHEAAHMVGARREARDLLKALENGAPELVRPAVLAALRAVFAVR